MHELLTKLGVTDEIQGFFNIGELTFRYGSSTSVESFAEGFHFVPAADEPWIWAPAAGSHVVVTHSVMEAIAFLTCNRHRFPDLHSVAFVALGRHLFPNQLALISTRFPNGKFTLVFMDDLLGRLTDIYIAAALRRLRLHLRFCGETIEIICNGRSICFEAKFLTLNVFHKAFSIRTLCMTVKPKLHASFLMQMLRPL